MELRELAVKELKSGYCDNIEKNSQGHLMIKSIEIKNFRCFDRLKLSNLKRVNIAVGANASGKTTFLEALLLVCGANPSTHFTLRQWRSLGDKVMISTELPSHHQIWEDLFRNFDETKPISIDFKGSSDLTRTLSVFYDKEQPITIPLGETLTEPSTPITFEWTKGKDIIGTSKASVIGGELKIEGSGVPIAGQYFTTGGAFTNEMVAEAFSDLKKEKRADQVVTAITNMFPFIRNIGTESFQGRVLLYADIPTIPRLTPLGLVSGGISKLTGILIAIAKQSKGVVMIDEIENGFYFDTMPEIWRKILEFAEENETQIFASTHSDETLKSLLPTIRDNQEKFCLLKAQRESDKCSITAFEGKYFKAAIEGNMEIRS